VPVAGIMRARNVMLVNPAVPAKTIPEFIAYAKANPAKINMATAGSGTTEHVFGELFTVMAGVDLVPIAIEAADLRWSVCLLGRCRSSLSPLPPQSPT